MVVEARDSNKKYVDARSSLSKQKPSTGLKNVTLWKQQAIDRILKDDELMKILKYSSPDWYAKKDLTDFEKQEMYGSQVFPFKFVDNNIEEEKKSFISVDVAHFAPLEEFRLFSRKFIHGYLYFFILVDKDIMITDYGVRSDLIMGRIYDIFNNSRIGVGEMVLATNTPLATDNNHYIGYSLGFKLAEIG